MHISQWLTDAKHFCGSNVLLVLIGNKMDLEETRVVSRYEAKLFAQDNDLLFFETSAKTGDYIEFAFLHSCSILMDQIMQGTFFVAHENGVWPDMISVYPSRHGFKSNWCEHIFEFIGSNFCCCCINEE